MTKTTGYKRFEATVRRQSAKTDHPVPLWELEFHGWHHFSGKNLILGRDFEALDTSGQEKALHGNAELMAEVSRQLDFSAITVPGGYWEMAPGHPAYFWLPDEARFEQIKILREILGNEIMLVASCPAVMAMPAADEYMEFAYTLMERPEEIDIRAKDLFSSGCELASRLLDLGVGALYTASDIADNHGPYFDPGQMERFILPYLDSWASHVHRQGGLSILHSDGNMHALLDSIAETSVQALQAIDPTAGMDLGRSFDQVDGRLCLCGNINCSLFIAGSPDEVYRATLDALQQAAGKGHLVLGASNAIEKELRKENYEALLRARNSPL